MGKFFVLRNFEKNKLCLLKIQKSTPEKSKYANKNLNSIFVIVHAFDVMKMGCRNPYIKFLHSTGT